MPCVALIITAMQQYSQQQSKSWMEERMELVGTLYIADWVRGIATVQAVQCKTWMFHLNSLVGTWAELLRVMPRGRKGGREEEGSKGEGDRGRGGREWVREADRQTNWQTVEYMMFLYFQLFQKGDVIFPLSRKVRTFWSGLVMWSQRILCTYKPTKGNNHNASYEHVQSGWYAYRNWTRTNRSRACTEIMTISTRMHAKCII